MISLLTAGLFLLTLTTGNSSAKSTVKTYVEGQGSVYNYLETQVNGQKQVLESSEPGEYTLELNSSSPASSSPASPQVIGISTFSAQTVTQTNLYRSFISQILEFVTRLISLMI